MYTPDREEINMAIEFVRACSTSDLIIVWNRSSEEWDNKSLVEFHSAICSTGRIDEIVKSIMNNKEDREK